MSQPDFLIIGVQKGGTTSLFLQLRHHPNLAASYKKEINFFQVNKNYQLGNSWYEKHFQERGSLKSFEATPGYFHTKFCPERVFQYKPDIQLILLLREPRERAWSNFHHNKRGPKIKERKDFLTAISWELPDGYLPEKKEFYGRSYHYLSVGNYIKHIENWLKYFPKEQLLILESEAYLKQTKRTLKQITDFLNIPEFENPQTIQANQGEGGIIPRKFRNLLAEYYRDVNQKLAEFLEKNYQITFSWLP